MIDLMGTYALASVKEQFFGEGIPKSSQVEGEKEKSSRVH